MLIYDLLYECQIDKYIYSEKKYKKCKYYGTRKILINIL